MCEQFMTLGLLLVTALLATSGALSFMLWAALHGQAEEDE